MGRLLIPEIRRTSCVWITDGLALSTLSGSIIVGSIFGRPKNDASMLETVSVGLSLGGALKGTSFKLTSFVVSVFCLEDI